MTRRFALHAFAIALSWTITGCGGDVTNAQLVGRTAGALTTRSLSQPYVWWSWPSTFKTLDSDLTVSADPGSSTTYFLAHQFELVDASAAHVTGGYIGLQTQTTGTGGQKGVMFSLWGATGGAAASGATCQAVSNEGAGWQCFRAYPWVAGKRYRLRIVNGGGLGYTGSVIDESTSPPTETVLGTIQAPSGAAGFGGTSVQWLEYYGSRPSACFDFPYIKALWSRPSGNGGSVVPAPSNAGATYGDGDCKRSAVIPHGADHELEAGTPGTVSLRYITSRSGQSVYPASTSDGCGGGALRADGTASTACTQIARVALPGGKVALQVDDGYYVSCANGGGSSVSATARTISTAESFTEASSLGKQTYKSASGRYLTAVNGGGGDVRCDALFASLNEQLSELANVASAASVSVSSENASTGQLGIKAIDGDVDGYPGDATREWATNGELAGAWIQLTWAAATAVQQVTLYDRPNTTDQVLAGTLLFSDGSSIAVGALPNDGSSGLTAKFAAKKVTWVKLRVDQATGSNIGLAEIQVFGAP